MKSRGEEEKEEIALSAVEFHSPDYVSVLNISFQSFLVRPSEQRYSAFVSISLTFKNT